MHAKDLLNDIVTAALPAADCDGNAARHFLRVFTSFSNMFLLAPQTISILEDYAEKENRFAMFALGRYHLCTQLQQDSMEKAKNYIIGAHELGLPEATVSLSMMYAYGDIGMVDRARANALLESAMREECEYAAEIYLRNIIFGLGGTPRDPLKAIGHCDRLLENDIRHYGPGEENPMWYYYRGCARQTVTGISSASDDYRKAAEMGVIRAWADLAITCSHNDEGEMTDRDAYLKAIEYGSSKTDYLCRYLLAISKVGNYDSMPEWTKQIKSKQLIINLEDAYSLGSSEAAETLGDIYYYGEYGQTEDNALAWKWYASGALLNSITCCEKMFGMMQDHYIETDEGFKDMIALKGARLGSEKLIGATVMAYTYGRLTEFGREIEQYYEPVFDQEETPDDDGRFDAYA